MSVVSLATPWTPPRGMRSMRKVLPLLGAVFLAFPPSGTLPSRVYPAAPSPTRVRLASSAALQAASRPSRGVAHRRLAPAGAIGVLPTF